MEAFIQFIQHLWLIDPSSHGGKNVFFYAWSNYMCPGTAGLFLVDGGNVDLSIDTANRSVLMKTGEGVFSNKGT